MARAPKSKARRCSNRLYRSSKISEYQFKRVLSSFVLDEPASRAAKHIDLSANSIDALYSKLRVYFYDAGLFMDIYEGGDPREGSTLADDEFEIRLIEFHMKRVAAKRGLTDILATPAYHFSESHWRFHYAVMIEGRSSGAIHRMMFAHLLEVIRHCGPVGASPERKEGLTLSLRHMDQRLLWMERNSVRFADPETRAQFREVRTL